jgi:hypothetical protein
LSGAVIHADRRTECQLLQVYQPTDAAHTFHRKLVTLLPRPAWNDATSTIDRLMFDREFEGHAQGAKRGWEMKLGE